MAIESINPATEEVLESFDEMTEAQIEEALAAADATYKQWRNRSFAERGDFMRRAAESLREEKPRFAKLMTLEMGKPIAEAEAEVDKCAWNLDFYAEHAARFLADESVETNARESFVAYEPLGVILAVMPWNFPFWQVLRFAAPALMAGNTVLLKHASNVPQCALAIEEIFRNAGLPEGAFKTLLVPGNKVDPIIADPRVKAITLTGSDITGSKVAETAGRHLKKCVLELGGSDPFIILADADLPAAAEIAARARCQNTGQSCIAAKRFIVVESVAEEFERLFVEEVRKLKVGDPLERDTRQGPLAREDLLDDLERQVQGSIQQGAKLATGGARLEGKGYYFEPTVLLNITSEMPAWREETFGPAAAVMRVKDAEQAVTEANDTEFGLGASIWTRDTEQGKALARRIEAGNVFINGMVASDPRLPFGGVKRSGYGRELAAFGIREFVNIQTIVVSDGTNPAHMVGRAPAAQAPVAVPTE